MLPGGRKLPPFLHRVEIGSDSLLMEAPCPGRRWRRSAYRDRLLSLLPRPEPGALPRRQKLKCTHHCLQRAALLYQFLLLSIHRSYRPSVPDHYFSELGMGARVQFLLLPLSDYSLLFASI